MNKSKSYYDLLGVDSNAAEEEVRRAYRKKIREYHPDLNPDKARAQEKSRQLNLALEVLTDPVKRQKYDEKLQRLGHEAANKEFEPHTESHTAADQDGFNFQSGFSSASMEGHEDWSPKTVGSFLSPTKIAAAGLSVVGIAVVSLWGFFQLFHTGQAGEDDAAQLLQVAELQAEIDSVKSKLRKQTDAHAKEIIRMEEEMKKLKKQNDVLNERLRHGNTSQASGLDDSIALFEDPELVEAIKGWLIEYRYAQQLIAGNTWTHVWWHPTHHQDLPLETTQTINVRMRPFLTYGGGMYITDELTQRKRWIGLFPTEMRPLALHAIPVWNEPDVDKIGQEVQALFSKR